MQNELCARRAVLCTQQALTCFCTDHPAILRPGGVDSANAGAGTPHHVPRANCKALCACLSLPSLISGEHSAVGSNLVEVGVEMNELPCLLLLSALPGSQAYIWGRARADPLEQVSMTWPLTKATSSSSSSTPLKPAPGPCLLTWPAQMCPLTYLHVLVPR